MDEERRELRTAAALERDLRRLGLGAGDTVMVHASMRLVGRLLHGPDALIQALRDVVGAAGTVVAYADWESPYEELLDPRGRMPDVWRDRVPGFDPATARAIRANGVFPEFLRTTPGALRSGNPGASIVALGARAAEITADHPLDYGYGPGTPLARLVALDAKVAMIGAPSDTMTLMHHAEHLARLPGKRVKRCEVPFATPAGTVWRMVEEFDTSTPIVDGLADDCFARILTGYVDGGWATHGFVGDAPTILCQAGDITAFAVRWLEENAGNGS